VLREEERVQEGVDEGVKGSGKEWWSDSEGSEDGLGMFDLGLSEEDWEDWGSRGLDTSQDKAHESETPGLVLLTAGVILGIGKGPMVDAHSSPVEE
jgi:hypothetical protein